jgi:hypothetical protein
MRQGDQIGRILAFWAIFSLRSDFENCKSFPNFKYAILNGKSYAQVLTKYKLGHILGDFFHKLTRSPWPICAVIKSQNFNGSIPLSLKTGETHPSPSQACFFLQGPCHIVHLFLFHLPDCLC